jgi:hypothetical protein
MDSSKKTCNKVCGSRFCPCNKGQKEVDIPAANPTHHSQLDLSRDDLSRVDFFGDWASA